MDYAGMDFNVEVEENRERDAAVILAAYAKAAHETSKSKEEEGDA